MCTNQRMDTNQIVIGPTKRSEPVNRNQNKVSRISPSIDAV